MAARSQKSAEQQKIADELQKCIENGKPVEGGLVLISLESEWLRDGVESRHLRAPRGEERVTVLGAIKKAYQRYLPA